MENIKRINLSFDQRKPDHERVYKLISRKSLKTEYVIKAVLEYEERRSDIITKEFIKEALVKALKEIGLHNMEVSTKQKEEINTEGDIPEEVFNIFDKM